MTRTTEQTDARLAAALAALRTIVNAMPADGGMVRLDGVELAAARAAIAKAEGGV